MKNATEAVNNDQSDESLPLASLRLLAPPLRLVSAALWKVIQQRDVMHYGKIEEFVTSVSATVPRLLSYRHQAKLTLGLQAKLILEHVRVSQPPDSELILSLLDRVRAPTLSRGKRKDQKVEMAVKNLHALVHTLLKDPARRKQYFQEEFDAQYGPEYDTALEKLMWEFLIRVDQLLPVPDLAQTVSWLTGAPAVIEECARCASQPQLLRTLLQHEKCLGHLDSAASIPSSIGDSILSALSLPPSGRLRHTNESGSTSELNIVPSPAPATERTRSKRTTRTKSPIAPVIGTILCKDLPANQDVASVMERDGEEVITETSDYTRVKSRSRSNSESSVYTTEEENFVGNVLVTVINQTSTSSEAEHSDEAPVQPVRKTKGRKRSSTQKRETRNNIRLLEQDKKSKREDSQEVVSDITSQEGKDKPDPITSCLKQLRVSLPRLDISNISQSVLINTTANEGQTTKSPRFSTEPWGCKVNGDSVNRKRKLSCTWTPEKDVTCTIKKQICAGSPCIPTVRPGRMDIMNSSEKGSPIIESTDDVIVDSEDEATERVKGKLFTTRYCKTKNDTYVPTLHEFWSPAFFRRDLLSPGNGCR